jgi:Holliday junction resolvase RusA-like endonuclease
MENQCIIGEPFSCNKMYVPVARGKMVKSMAYRKWIDENSKLMNLRKPKSFPIVVDIMIMANHQWSLRNDPDNVVKPVIDLMARCGVVPDDTNQYIERIGVRVLYFPGRASLSVSYEEPDEVLINY